MKRRGNLLRCESKFIDSPTAEDYCQMENITMTEVERFTRISVRELLDIHKNNEHLFFIICIGCRHIKAIKGG